MKSFFDNDAEKILKELKKEIQRPTILECASYFNLDLTDVCYCKNIDEKELHKMTKNQLETECGKTFKEGYILPGWMTDIEKETKCHLCFQTKSLKYKRRK